MPTNISSITINASVNRVWDTVKNPDLVKLWQYGSKLQTTWQVDNPIKFSTEWEGKLYEQWGIVKEVIPYSLVKYSLFAPRPDLEDKSENYFMMSYVLTTVDDATKLEIIQEDNRPNAVQEAPQDETNPILITLKEVAESSADK